MGKSEQATGKIYNFFLMIEQASLLEKKINLRVFLVQKFMLSILTRFNPNFLMAKFTLIFFIFKKVVDRFSSKKNLN